jgi:hypothetical protein
MRPETVSELLIGETASRGEIKKEGMISGTDFSESYQ